ncbi:hypothetical protein BB560_005649 [Smittium megazygosporum]|uniref:Uncharacterized protein n=1 Tax=Smittium megazygosporum TaxID=133381 RepID=A0A2T9Z1T0_9FUNG|nr:hypothetical protein BB560_005649 [Smittium megazygosporum]
MFFNKKSPVEKLVSKSSLSLKSINELMGLVDNSVDAAREAVEYILRYIFDPKKRTKYFSFYNRLVFLINKPFFSITDVLFVDENYKKLEAFLNNKDVYSNQKLNVLSMIKVWSFLFEDNISVNEALMQVLTKAIYATELQPSYNYFPRRPQSWVIPEHVKEALTRGNMVEDPWYFRSNARFSLELSSVQPDSSNFHHTQEFSEQVLSKCEKITRICQSFKEILLSLDLDEDIESNEAVQSIRSKIASYLPIVTNYIEIFQEHNGDVLDTALKTNDMIKDVQDYYVSLVEEMMVAKAMADSLSDPNVQVDTDIYPDCSASFEIENNWTSSSRSVTSIIGPNGKNPIR